MAKKTTLTPNDVNLLQDKFLQSDIDEGWHLVLGYDEQSGRLQTEDFFLIDDNNVAYPDTDLDIIPMMYLFREDRISPGANTVYFNQQFVRKVEDRAYVRTLVDGEYKWIIVKNSLLPTLKSGEFTIPEDAVIPSEASPQPHSFITRLKQGNLNELIQQYPQFIKGYNTDNKGYAQGFRLKSSSSLNDDEAVRLWQKLFVKFIPWGTSTRVTIYDNWEVEFTGVILHLEMKDEYTPVLKRDENGNVLFKQSDTPMRISLFDSFEESVGALPEGVQEELNKANQEYTLDETTYNHFVKLHNQEWSRRGYSVSEVNWPWYHTDKVRDVRMNVFFDSACDFIRFPQRTPDANGLRCMFEYRGNNNAILWDKLFAKDFNFEELEFLPVLEGWCKLFTDTMLVELNGAVIDHEGYILTPGTYSFRSLCSKSQRDELRTGQYIEIPENYHGWPYRRGQYTSNFRFRYHPTNLWCTNSNPGIMMKRMIVDNDVFGNVLIKDGSRPESPFVSTNPVIEINHISRARKDNTEHYEQIQELKAIGGIEPGFNPDNFTTPKGYDCKLTINVYPMIWELKDYPWVSVPALICHGGMLDIYQSLYFNTLILHRRGTDGEDLAEWFLPYLKKVVWWYDSTKDSYILEGGQYRLDIGRTRWGLKFIPAPIAQKYIDLLPKMLPLVEPPEYTHKYWQAGLMYSKTNNRAKHHRPQDYDAVCGLFRDELNLEVFSVDRCNLARIRYGNLKGVRVKYMCHYWHGGNKKMMILNGKDATMPYNDDPNAKKSGFELRGTETILDILDITDIEETVDNDISRYRNTLGQPRVKSYSENYAWLQTGLLNNFVEKFPYWTPWRYTIGFIITLTDYRADFHFGGSTAYTTKEFAFRWLNDNTKQMETKTETEIVVWNDFNREGGTIYSVPRRAILTLDGKTGSFLYRHSQTLADGGIVSIPTLSPHPYQLARKEWNLQEISCPGKHYFGVPVITTDMTFRPELFPFSAVTIWCDGRNLYQGRYPEHLEALRKKNLPRLIWTGNKKTSTFKYMPALRNQTVTYDGKTQTFEKVSFGREALNSIQGSDEGFFQQPRIYLIDGRGRIIRDGATLQDVELENESAFVPAWTMINPLELSVADNSNIMVHQPILIPNQFRFVDKDTVQEVTIPTSPIRSVEERKMVSDQLIKPEDTRESWDNWTMLEENGNEVYLYDDVTYKGSHAIFDVDLLGLYSAPNNYHFLDGNNYNKLFWNETTNNWESGSGLLMSPLIKPLEEYPFNICDCYRYCCDVASKTAERRDRFGAIPVVGLRTNGYFQQFKDYWDIPGNQR